MCQNKKLDMNPSDRIQLWNLSNSSHLWICGSGSTPYFKKRTNADTELDLNVVGFWDFDLGVSFSETPGNIVRSLCCSHSLHKLFHSVPYLQHVRHLENHIQIQSHGMWTWNIWSLLCWIRWYVLDDLQSERGRARYHPFEHLKCTLPFWKQCFLQEYTLDPAHLASWLPSFLNMQP